MNKEANRKIWTEKSKWKTFILQGIKFGIVGCINTILSYVIYLLCYMVGMHYLLCEFLAFIITVGISYTLNKWFVFQYNDVSVKEIIISLAKTYLSYFATSFVLNAVLLILWIEIVGIPETIAPLVSLLLTVPMNFLLNKFWVHKK